jgi:hypothetical protein
MGSWKAIGGTQNNLFWSSPFQLSSSVPAFRFAEKKIFRKFRKKLVQHETSALEMLVRSGRSSPLQRQL